MNIQVQKTKNIQKTYLLMFLFLVLVVGIGWVFSYFFQNQNILYFAVGFSLLMNVFGYWFSDKVVLKMSGAKLISRNDNRELFDSVERLVRQAGLLMPKLYVINDPSPNAFATGRNAKNSAVAVTTGLLNILDKRELDGVIAHELSHIQNKDILIATIVVVLVGFVALLSDFFIRMSIFGGLKRDDNQVGGIITIVGIVLAILTPFIATLIQLAISRKREFLADASAVALTHNSSGLASALEKISQNSLPIKKASHATAHLYISDPYKRKKEKGKSLLMKMFMTHPPVEERVRVLRGGQI